MTTLSEDAIVRGLLAMNVPRARAEAAARREKAGKNIREIIPTAFRKHSARRDVEHQEQRQLIAWADAMAWRWPELGMLYAIANGGARSKGTAGRMKAEGVRAGVPDLCLPVARGHFHGLYIELKAPGGRPTPEQRVWCTRLRDHGYRAEIVQGWEAARDLIVRYLTS